MREAFSRDAWRDPTRARVSPSLVTSARLPSQLTAVHTLVSEHARRLSASAARSIPASVPTRRSQRWTIVRAAEDAEKAKDEEDTPEARVEGAMAEFAAAGYPSEDGDATDPVSRTKAMNGAVDDLNNLMDSEVEVLGKAFDLLEKMGVKGLEKPPVARSAMRRRKSPKRETRAAGDGDRDARVRCMHKCPAESSRSSPRSFPAPFFPKPRLPNAQLVRCGNFPTDMALIASRCLCSVNSCVSTNPSSRNPASSNRLASKSVRSSTNLSLKYENRRCARENCSSRCGSCPGSRLCCLATLSLRSYASMSSMYCRRLSTHG